MINFLDRMIISCKTQVKHKLQMFKSEQRGDTNFVSIMLIIVVVVAIAILFRSTLTEVANTALQKVTDFVGGGGTTGTGGVAAE